MVRSLQSRRLCSLLLIIIVTIATRAVAQEPEIPDALKPWTDWVMWDQEHLDCPPIYSSDKQRVCFWPSAVQMNATSEGAVWSIPIRAFHKTWVPLPGSDRHWPIDVTIDDLPVVVVPRDGQPCVEVPAGKTQVAGKFKWNRMPQRIAIPRSLGVLSLSVSEQTIATPTWDADGRVWLQRIRREEDDAELLSALVYRMIDDGNPIWLRTRIELTVAGKSREEILGTVIPQGWQVSRIESPIPVAIDDRSEMKAQVRRGKWSIQIDAYRTSDLDEIAFAEDAIPIVGVELVGLRNDPHFRVSQLEGMPTIDVSQTSFPDDWRGVPVHQWSTEQPMRLTERIRGMGDQSTEALTITRRFWLDSDGAGFTYQDRLKGKRQRIWRLDANDQSELGVVRMDGDPQLITSNPKTNSHGVEVRIRNLDVEAIGRADFDGELSAVGWQTSAESLAVTMTLPPGWRAFAVFGADRVDGDWLTAWSLLDLFLLLIFTFAVVRLFGWVPGLIALLAFGLAFHEWGAPRFAWLFLLIPIALLRVVNHDKGRRLLSAWKYAATGLFLLCFVPFVASQIQSAIYPQLEPAGYRYGSRSAFQMPFQTVGYSAGSMVDASIERAPEKAKSLAIGQGTQRGISKSDVSNLMQDPKSKIQTGPAQPQWTWNDIHCRWNGPVDQDQSLRPVLISMNQNRILSVARIALLLLLAFIVLRGKRLGLRKRQPTKAAAIMAAMVCMMPATSQAQFPDASMLDTLRDRLIETPDVFPGAADLPLVELTISESKIDMRVDVHAVVDVAVPLPGKLPAWSPVRVTIDEDQDSDADELEDAIIRRRDGYLWALVPAGVHTLRVEGRLPDQSDWEWTFQLTPRIVRVDAPGWDISGINADGVPDDQVFFVRQQATQEDKAAYDRTDFEPVVVIDRYLEFGLISKVRTVVTRLSEPRQAVSLVVALLPGESVLSDEADVVDGGVSVRMGASVKSFSWDSELPAGKDIILSSSAQAQSVQRWHLVTSPIWNVSMTGLAPAFEAGQSELIPTWRPWPNETVTLRFSKPVAIQGDVMTIQSVRQTTNLGSRRRIEQLGVDVDCSVAGDFAIELRPDAEISEVTRNGQAIPIQRDGETLIVPVQAGAQMIETKWQMADRLQTVQRNDPVGLRVTASNVTQIVQVPDNRWVLWVSGPLRGAAVRFWTILVVAVLAALALGSLPSSPLRRVEWILLAIGLTQVHLIAAMMVVGWLFLLAYRGRQSEPASRFRWVNFLQILIVLATPFALGILIVVVGEGLLGNPDMFIRGSGSTRTVLQWFQPRIDGQLPEIQIVSVSVWFYRVLMLAWALWLATALLRWLTWGWSQFAAGGVWRRRPKTVC